MSLTNDEKVDVLQLIEDAVKAFRLGLSPAAPPPAPPQITLTPSGSITVTADNQVVENKLITGKILVQGKNNVVIRNCEIRHAGGNGIEAWDCINLLVEDVKIINTSAPTGQVPNPAECRSVYLVYDGPYTLRRVTVTGSQGLYAYQTTGLITLSFFEGHNIRGWTTNNALKGQLVQLNQCKGGLLMEDFSVENDPQNSWSEDNVSFYSCTTGQYVVRRGLIDGNNSPSGVGIMGEVNTAGLLVEDVDCVHQMNGCFYTYSGTNNAIYRRCRAKDTIQKDQGRGPSRSNYLTFGTVDSSGTRYEQCQYFNVKYDNLAYDVSKMAAKDWQQLDFTPRAPIRNKFPW